MWVPNENHIVLEHLPLGFPENELTVLHSNTCWSFLQIVRTSTKNYIIQSSSLSLNLSRANNILLLLTSIAQHGWSFSQDAHHTRMGSLSFGPLFFMFRKYDHVSINWRVMWHTKIWILKASHHWSHYLLVWIKLWLRTFPSTRVTLFAHSTLIEI
jgi:hypothetical protein